MGLVDRARRNIAHVVTEHPLVPVIAGGVAAAASTYGVFYAFYSALHPNHPGVNAVLAFTSGTMFSRKYSVAPLAITVGALGAIAGASVTQWGERVTRETTQYGTTQQS